MLTLARHWKQREDSPVRQRAARTVGNRVYLLNVLRRPRRSIHIQSNIPSGLLTGAAVAEFYVYWL